jgi:hypothetical protein
MADEQSPDWFGAIRRGIDLWLALQLTIGVALAVGVDAVTDYSTRLNLFVLTVVPLLLALVALLTGRSPETEPLWAGGFAVLGAAIGIGIVSVRLGIAVPGYVLYLLAITVVIGGYALHRGFKSLARLTAPK